jgi:hypothetical protein
MDAAMESVETVEEWVLIVLRVTRSSPSSVRVLEGKKIRPSRTMEEKPG